MLSLSAASFRIPERNFDVPICVMGAVFLKSYSKPEKLRVLIWMSLKAGKQKTNLRLVSTELENVKENQSQDSNSNSVKIYQNNKLSFFPNAM